MPRPKSHFVEAGPQPEPCPEWAHLVELGPEGRGVGPWVPQDKHRLLAEYLFSTRKAWGKPVWKHRVFMDPFCAAGRVRVTGESFTRDGGALVAWRESVAAGVPFTHVFVGDKDGERVQACTARLRALGAPVQGFVGVASETVPQMVAATPPRQALCLAFLDPYSLTLLSYDLFQALAKLRVDIAAHFSTMDLLRNADLEFDPSRTGFEATAPGWRTDPAVLSSNATGRRVAFLEYWLRLVGQLGFTHSRAMPLIRDEASRPLYRLAFFAHHELPLRVWKDVAEGHDPTGQLF